MIRLSEDQRGLLLLAHANDNHALQSTALAEVYGLPPNVRLRGKSGRHYSAQTISDYHKSRSSLTRSLRRLEHRGLIERNPGRATGSAGYRLTAEGQAVAHDLQEETAA